METTPDVVSPGHEGSKIPAAPLAPGFEMVSRSCPLCGSTDDARVFAEANFDPSRLDAFAFASRKLPEYMHYRLVLCPACDLLYANPAPTLESLARSYHEAAFDTGEEAHWASRTYERFLPPIVARLPDLAGAIDIGTGDGAFLERLLAAGFTGVVGVEPSAAPIAAARDEIRPLIRQGLFRASDFEAGHYSLVACFQTIEHAYDPLDLARGAFELLKPGGAALFVGHNRRGVVSRLLGMKSPIFDIEHLQLFSPTSARKLLERAGFADVEVKVVVNRYPLQYWTKLAPLPGVKSGVLSILRWSRVGRLPIPMPVGNLAVIGYKR
jgi:SAM-dependent methyltransferase